MRCAKFGAVLLALTLALCLVSLYALGGIVARADALLSRAQTLACAGRYEEAAEAGEAAAQLWRDRRPFLGAVLRHSESDELEFLFARLPAYKDADARAEFLAVCLELRAQLSHVLDAERPRLYNIL